MPGLRSLVLGVSLVALTQAACSPALDWREVRPAEADGLIAWFPCKPQMAERPMSWPGAEAVTVRVLSCRADGLIWSLAYARMTDAPLVPQTLTGWATAWRARNGYDSVAIAPLHGRGMVVPEEGHAWTLTARASQTSPRFGRAWHFSHGLTVFQASVWGDRLQESLTKGEDVTATFTNGLHFPS